MPVYGADNKHQGYLKRDCYYNFVLPEDGCKITAETCRSVSLKDGCNCLAINTKHLDVLASAVWTEFLCYREVSRVVTMADGGS